MKQLRSGLVFVLIVLLVCVQAFSFGEASLGEDGCSIGEAAVSQKQDVPMERPADRPVYIEREAAPAEPAAPVQDPAPAAPVQETQAVEGVSTSTLTTANSQYTQTVNFVKRMYKVVLGRDADPVGLKDWTDGLMDGTFTAADIVSGFFNSDEYHLKNKSNKEIVTDCYKAMLGRDPDKTGLEGWVDALDIGMTSQAILAGFVGSTEFTNLAASYGILPGTISFTSARDENYERTYFVYRLYYNCLGRLPDPVGQEAWCRALSNNATGAQVASGFVFSPELENYHLNNEEFVWMLYDTILGRTPDTSGLNSWTDVLNYTNTRERVFNGFLFSPEFALQCQRSGINVGSTIAEPDDSEEWQANVQILQLCNYYRAVNGVAPLHTREDLWRDVAMLRARELVTLFSHTRPDGTNCYTAWDQAGLDYYWAAGENIAGGYTSPSEVVSAWMNSPGHRANILDTDFEDLATGYVYNGNSYYKTYYSQNFCLLPW